MITGWKRWSVLATCAAVGPGTTVVPASPSIAVPDSPECVIHVTNARVELRALAATPVAVTLERCPAGAITDGSNIYWYTRESSTNGSGPDFYYQPRAVYPSERLTALLYSWETGTYDLPAQSQSSYFDGPPDYAMHYYALKMTGGPIVAKLVSRVTLKVTKAGSRRTLAIVGRRDASWGIVAASKVKVTVLRNGRVFQRVRLDKRGKATVAGRGVARWSATLPETATNWSAISAVVRR